MQRMKQIGQIAVLGLALPTSLPAQQVQQNAQYQYNAKGFVSEERTTASNGDIVMKRYRYISDLGIGANCIANSQYLTGNIKGYINLLNLNQIDQPIETYTVLQKGGGPEQVVGAELLLYQLNKPYIQKKYALESAVPLQNFTPCTVNNSTCALSFSSQYKVAINYSEYDAYGNPGLTYDRSGRNATAYLYDDTHTYKTMEAQNATLNQVAYTNFEGSAAVGWNIPTSQRYGFPVFNGLRAYGLLDGDITLNTNLPQRSYIISFWMVPGGNASLINGTMAYIPTYTGPVINCGQANDWQYVEYRLPNFSTAGFKLYGNAVIDELRMYPVHSKMVTYTYGPDGMLDQTDEKNKIIRYEYDNQGRLLHVRDLARNIIRKYEHKVQQAD